MSESIYDQLDCDESIKVQLRQLDNFKKMKINDLFNEILLFRVGLYGHPIFIKIVEYMMDDPEATYIFTPEEIAHYKEEMKSELKYHTDHNIDKCFESNIKTPHNNFELSIINSYVYSHIPVYLSVINLLYRSLQNYYGRGKIKLDLKAPEDFINNVMTLMTAYNYNPEVIRNQIKTVKVMELMIKKMDIVVVNHMIPALRSDFQCVIKSNRDIAVKCVEKRVEESDFGTTNLAELKTLYKKRDKEVYKSLIEIINNIIEQNISLKTLFQILYQQKASVMNYPIFQLVSESKEKELDTFIKEKKGAADCFVNFENLIMKGNVLRLAFELYQTNVKLRKIISSKENEEKELPNLD